MKSEGGLPGTCTCAFPLVLSPWPSHPKVKPTNRSVSVNERSARDISGPFWRRAEFHVCLLWKTQRSQNRVQTARRPEGTRPTTGATPAPLPLVEPVSRSGLAGVPDSEVRVWHAPFLFSCIPTRHMRARSDIMSAQPH